MCFIHESVKADTRIQELAFSKKKKKKQMLVELSQLWLSVSVNSYGPVGTTMVNQYIDLLCLRWFACIYADFLETKDGASEWHRGFVSELHTYCVGHRFC